MSLRSLTLAARCCASKQTLRARYRRIRARFAATPPELNLTGILRSRVEGREVELIANGASNAIAEQLRALKPEELTVEALTLEEIFMVTLQ